LFYFLLLIKQANGETDRRLNDGLEHSFDSSVRVGVGRRLRRTGPLTVYSFAIGRAQSDRPTNKLTGGRRIQERCICKNTKLYFIKNH